MWRRKDHQKLSSAKHDHMKGLYTWLETTLQSPWTVRRQLQALFWGGVSRSRAVCVVMAADTRATLSVRGPARQHPSGRCWQPVLRHCRRGGARGRPGSPWGWPVDRVFLGLSGMFNFQGWIFQETPQFQVPEPQQRIDGTQRWSHWEREGCRNGLSVGRAGRSGTGHRTATQQRCGTCISPKHWSPGEGTVRAAWGLLPERSTGPWWRDTAACGNLLTSLSLTSPLCPPLAKALTGKSQPTSCFL